MLVVSLFNPSAIFFTLFSLNYRKGGRRGSKGKEELSVCGFQLLLQTPSGVAPWGNVDPSAWAQPGVSSASRSKGLALSAAEKKGEKQRIWHWHPQHTGCHRAACLCPNLSEFAGVPKKEKKRQCDGGKEGGKRWGSREEEYVCLHWWDAFCFFSPLSESIRWSFAGDLYSTARKLMWKVYEGGVGSDLPCLNDVCSNF